MRCVALALDVEPELEVGTVIFQHAGLSLAGVADIILPSRVRLDTLFGTVAPLELASACLLSQQFELAVLSPLVAAQILE